MRVEFDSEMMKNMHLLKPKPTGGKRQVRKKEGEGQRPRGRTMQRGGRNSKENEEDHRWNDEGHEPVKGTRKQLSGDVDDDFERTTSSEVGELTASKNPSGFNSNSTRTSYNRA